jgi:hypothetical protein
MSGVHVEALAGLHTPSSASQIPMRRRFPSLRARGQDLAVRGASYPDQTCEQYDSRFFVQFGTRDRFKLHCAASYKLRPSYLVGRRQGVVATSREEDVRRPESSDFTTQAASGKHHGNAEFFYEYGMQRSPAITRAACST